MGGKDPRILTRDDKGDEDSSNDDIYLNELGKMTFALYFIADPGTKL